MRAMIAGLAVAAVTAALALAAGPAALAGPVPDGEAAPPLIGMVNGSGEVIAKEGSLTAGWNDEWPDNAAYVVAASDSAGGPQIGVVTEGTVTNPYDNEAMVKEGSLGAGWNDEYGNVAAIALGSDPVNGPLIGVQDIEDGPDGRLLAKSGSLSAGWTVENTEVAPGAFDVSG
jgi:hypothetical protein